MNLTRPKMISTSLKQRFKGVFAIGQDIFQIEGHLKSSLQSLVHLNTLYTKISGLSKMIYSLASFFPQILSISGLTQLYKYIRRIS